jgi:hypothetical protein
MVHPRRPPRRLLSAARLLSVRGRDKNKRLPASVPHRARTPMNLMLLHAADSRGLEAQYRIVTLYRLHIVHF